MILKFEKGSENGRKKKNDRRMREKFARSNGAKEWWGPSVMQGNRQRQAKRRCPICTGGGVE